VEFPLLLLAVMLPAAAAAGSLLLLLLTAARARGVPAGILLRPSPPVSGSQHDLQLVDLIPLGIGPLPLRNREQRLQTGTG
jgi:hypothetical protein